MIINIPNLNNLRLPPVVGQFYLVPHIWFEYRKEKYSIPILDGPHTDKKLGGNNAIQHIHIDLRFINNKRLHYLYRTNLKEIMDSKIFLVQNYSEIKKCPHKFVMKKAKCFREQPIFPLHVSVKVNKELDPICMRYPHRGTYLGSMPIIDGVVQCPSHGLKFKIK